MLAILLWPGSAVGRIAVHRPGVTGKGCNASSAGVRACCGTTGTLGMGPALGVPPSLAEVTGRRRRHHLRQSGSWQYPCPLWLQTSACFSGAGCVGVAKAVHRSPAMVRWSDALAQTAASSAGISDPLQGLAVPCCSPGGSARVGCAAFGLAHQRQCTAQVGPGGGFGVLGPQQEGRVVGDHGRAPGHGVRHGAQPAQGLPPNTVMITRLTQSMLSTLRCLNQTQAIWQKVAAMATPVAT